MSKTSLPEKKAPALKRANTSASNLFRRRLCPGSGRMEDGIAEQNSEWSAEGVKLHRLFWTGERPDWLTIDQVKLLDEADALTADFFELAIRAGSVPDDAEYIDRREVPMYFVDALGHRLFPGHVDLIREWPTAGTRAIVDFKSGFGEIDSADQNDQLGAYAVMSDEPRHAAVVGVAIVQPRNFGPHRSVDFLEPFDISRWQRDITAVFEAQEDPSAPLAAGEQQCRHCKAKTFCEAYREKFLVVEKFQTKAPAILDNDELAMYATAIRYAEKIKDEIMDELRLRIQEGRMPGWKLRNTGDVREVKDPMKLYWALHQFLMQPGVNKTAVPGLPPEVFDKCRTVSWGKLEKLLQELTGASEKAAKELLREIAEPLCTITPKQKAPVREKESKPALQ